MPLIAPLHKLLQERPLERKILLTATRAQGHQWLEQIVRSHGPVLNTEVHTLESWALERCKLTIAKKRLRYITDTEAMWITCALLQEEAKIADSYLSGVTVTPGVTRAFHRAIAELREAGVRSEREDAEFPAAQESAAALEQAGRKGFLLRKMLHRYEQALVRYRYIDYASLAAVATAADTMVIVDEFAIRNAADRRLLHRLTGGEYVTLQAEPTLPKRASFFRAVGPMAEIREVLRRIAASGVSWDQVEVMAPGDHAAIYNAVSSAGIPCAFAGGLPISITNPGKAAQRFLQWIESGYAASVLLTASKQGVLRFGDQAVRELEGIGWGRERYRRVEVLRDVLRELDDDALASPGRLLRISADFAAQYAAVTGDADAQALDRLREAAAPTVAEGVRMSPSLAIRYAQETLEGLRVLNGMPAPGKLYVSSYENGGQSGRTHTFILGMTEQQWTQPLKQDPILLDEERISISEELLTSAQKAELRIRERRRRLSMIQGELTVSFAASEDQMPAFDMLQMYRSTTGRADADFADLLSGIGAIARYFSGAAPMSAEAVYERYNGLHQGRRANVLRQSLELTPYDGILDTDRHPVKLPSAFSASSLELFAACPLKFFYSNVLGVRVKEAPVFDRTKWLNAAQRGSLLHEIFNRYVMSVRGQPHSEALLDTITEEVIRRYAEEVPAPSGHIWRKEADSIRADVRIFFAVERQRKTKPVYTELQVHSDEGPLHVELDGLTMPIRGFVDRVDEIEPHKYKIYDYKTGNPRKYESDEVFAGGTQLQLPLYGAAVEQWLRSTGRDVEAQVVESAYMFPTERGMGEEVSRPQNKREELAALLLMVRQAMEAGLYPPASDEKQCSWCDYQAVCAGHAEHFKEKRKLHEKLNPILEVNGYV